MPNPTGEASAKSSESAGTGTASAFFAQMGQILNPGDAGRDPQSEGKPAEAASNATGQDLIGLLLGVALVPSQPTGTNPVPVQNLPSSSSNPPEEKTGADLATETGSKKKCRNGSISGETDPGTSVKPGKEMMASRNPFELIDPVQPIVEGENAVLSDSQAEIDIQTEAAPVVKSVKASRNPYELSDPAQPAVEEENAAQSISQAETGIQAEIVPDAKTESPLRLQTNVGAGDIPVAAMDSPKQIVDSIIGISDSGIKAGAINSKPSAKSQPNDRESETSGETASEPSLSDSSFRSMDDADVASEGLSPNLQNKTNSASITGKTEGNPVGLGTGRNEPARLKTVQDVPENVSRESRSSIWIHAEDAERIPNQSGSNVGINNTPVAAKAEPSQEYALQSEFSKLTILRKQESFSQSNSSNTGAGDSYANQGQSREEPGPRAAQGIKPESSPSGFGQIRASIGERLQEAPTAFAVNVARAVESRSIAGESAAPVSTSQPRDFVLQVADQIRIQAHDGNEEIRIQLKPESLGRLEIRVETTLNGVTARITTESSNVKSYLENNLQILQQTLQDQGLKVDKIHIVIQDAFDFQSASGNASQSGHAGSGQAGRDPHSHTHSSGSAQTNPTDEMTIDPITWRSLNPNSRFYTVA
jgi:flagellar hook-length control protein FliK